MGEGEMWNWGESEPQNKASKFSRKLLLFPPPQNKFKTTKKTHTHTQITQVIQRYAWRDVGKGN
jgi:hypothetical protein